MPGLYAKDSSQLKIGQAVLLVFVVGLLTAGYSFTALLCFACRNEFFQAEGVFMYALPLIFTHHMLIYIQTRSRVVGARPHLDCLQLPLLTCLPLGYFRHNRYRRQRHCDTHVWRSVSMDTPSHRQSR
jgi:MFS-type transporter involved in bile tolerance (Atg22 family)